MCCGYSLEVPQRGASNEYPQHMFLWRNKKNINTLLLKKASNLKLLLLTIEIISLSMSLKVMWPRWNSNLPSLHLWSHALLTALCSLSSYMYIHNSRKEGYPNKQFCISSPQKHVVGTHQKRLSICFLGEP